MSQQTVTVTTSNPTVSLTLADGATVTAAEASTTASVVSTGSVSSPFVDIHTGGAIVSNNLTAALQATIDNQAPPGTGAVADAGTVFIPVGEWTLDTTITFIQQAVRIKGAGPGTVISWTGPAGDDMFNVQDSSRVSFEDLTLLGNATNPPRCAIYFEAPTIPVVGSNEYCNVERVMIGRRYHTAGNPGDTPMEYGLRVGGVAIGNNDQNAFRDCQIADCTVAGISIDDVQNRWGVIDNCFMDRCAIGLNVKSKVTCLNLQFNGSTTADLNIIDGEVLIYGYWSEQAERLWNQDSLSSLRIFGGAAQLHAQMVGNTYYAESLIAGDHNLVLVGLNIEDQSATGAILRVSGSSSLATPAQVFIRGCQLPDGDSDAGYEFDGFAAGTPLFVDIQQGTYWRRQVVQSSNAVGAFHLPPTKDPLQPTNTVGATIPRWAATSSLVPTSGTLYLFAADLAAGTLVSSISFQSLAAAVAPTNQWFGLFNASRVALALTADDTTTAWAASTVKTLALTSPVAIPADGLYYFGIMQAAGTPATLQSGPASTTSSMIARTPSLAPICDAGLTTPPGLPFTATPATTNTRIVYANAT